ncbi:MAG: TetR/AcrR family transcriptional regulator [Sneathiella sp.]
MQQEPAHKRKRGRPPKQDGDRLETRDRLIRKGTEILTEKGFSSTGIEEFLKEAGVPKGSFYHYFPNKDAFGLAVIENYGKYFATKLDKSLLDEDVPPLDRLSNFIADACRGMARYNYKRGCLIGNLGQEMGALDETFRLPLEAVFKDWQGRIAHCLEQAKANQEIPEQLNCEDIAAFFWIGWEGAILRSKLVESPEPLELFAEQFLKMIKPTG